MGVIKLLLLLNNLCRSTYFHFRLDLLAHVICMAISGFLLRDVICKSMLQKLYHTTVNRRKGWSHYSLTENFQNTLKVQSKNMITI